MQNSDDAFYYTYRQSSLEFVVDYDIKHRKVDNSQVDHVAPLLSYYKPKPASTTASPQKKVQHFKV